MTNDESDAHINCEMLRCLLKCDNSTSTPTTVRARLANSFSSGSRSLPSKRQPQPESNQRTGWLRCCLIASPQIS